MSEQNTRCRLVFMASVLAGCGDDDHAWNDGSDELGLRRTDLEDGDRR